MKQITQFPRIPFAVLPTPLYKLEAISREYGKNIYIKRDDMIGVALGGNKVRKLEFLLADAHANGADVVLTAGGPQSNHAMLTAACAAKLGMKSILVLKKRGELTGGNQILDRIYGADVRFVDTDTYDDVYAEMERIMDELRKVGHTPYFIPVGGSVPLGSLGYVNCAKEIAEQAHLGSCRNITWKRAERRNIAYGLRRRSWRRPGHTVPTSIPCMGEASGMPRWEAIRTTPTRHGRRTCTCG